MAPDIYTHSNRSLTGRVRDEMAKRRLASLITAVREHEARTGRLDLSHSGHDQALYRHARDLYERS